MITVNHVSKTYLQGETQIHALSDVSLQIDPGETVAIIGTSGSGKSTLMSLMAGLDSPESGSIHFNETNITQLSEKELSQFRAENIGIVFQQFHLMPHLTAMENVMLPMELTGKSDPESTAKKLLDQVGLSHRLHHRPHELSGGECQRVAIARATSVKPKLLLADEPSGNLDFETGKIVMDVIFDQVNGGDMTLVLVTHDRELANRCSRTIEIKGGRV
tara:strand:+ start:115412 stop:116065 length:654 start_codon:yes stop_codon:yes gene_type:complete